MGKLVTMMYPQFFPEERSQELAEKKVFDRLKEVSDCYDVFYSKRFVTDGQGKKAEFEVDFLIVSPEKAMVCLEVKGGVGIRYAGESDQWFRSGQPMDKRPDAQASAACHGVIQAFQGHLNSMAVGWALCFPDCQLSGRTAVPVSLDRRQIVDEQALLYIDQSLDDLFQFVQGQHLNRKGMRRFEYEKFKKALLRDLDFVPLMGTRLRRAQKQFVKLERAQIEALSAVTANRHLLVSGPAGSGKTVLAKTLAQDWVNEGKRVLLMCYNRTLANKLRYEFDRDEANIEVTTYHSLARRIIKEADPDWWGRQKASESEDFWALDVPAKMEECLPFFQERYAALVVDEGQDFKEFWYEMLFQLLHENGRRVIFLDEMQNIFGHYENMPEESVFTRFQLRVNCRNSKAIVRYLSQVVDQDIPSYDDSPEGTEVLVAPFDSPAAQLNFLESEIKELVRQDIQPFQILILLDGPKKESCLCDVQSIGGQFLSYLDNKARFAQGTVHFSTIETFKGLECDVVFVVSSSPQSGLDSRKRYTSASRARFKLYVLERS